MSDPWRNRGALVPLVAVALTALLVRLLYLAAIRPSPFFTAPVGVAGSYVAMADAIAAGDLAGGNAAYWQPPLYGYVLAAWRAIAGGPLAIRAVQFLLGTATVLLATRLTARLLGRRASLLVGFAGAVYGPFLFFEGRLLPASLVSFLSIAGLAALERARGSEAIAPRIMAGLFFGAAALAHPEAFFVALVLGLGLLWLERTAPAYPRGAPRGMARAGAPGRRGAGARALAFLGAALLVTLLATARNWIVARDLVWVSADGGLRYFLGNNARSDETLAIPPGRTWLDLVETPHREAGLTLASARSRYFYAAAGRFMRERPLAYARLLATKAARFLAGYETTRGEDLYAARGESRLLAGLVWHAGPFGFPFGLVSPLAVLGAVLFWPRRRELALVYLFAAAYAIATIAFFVTASSRLPAVPALLVLAAGAVDWMLARRRVPGLTLRFGVAAGALLLLLNLNPAVPRDIPTSESHRLRAAAEYEGKRYAAAVRAQARAIELAPGRAELHFDQGLYLTAAGDTAGAIAAYRRAIELAPGYGEPKVNLANLLVHAGDFRSAVRLYIEAAVGDPDLLPAHMAVGSAFLHSGHPDSALARFEHVLARDPAHEEATLGRIAALSDLGRGDEAVAAGRAATATFGDTPAILAARGRALKVAGRNTEAVAALKAALAAGPERADTWVTLGQCYRNLGQLEQAEAAQKQAIALAPTLVAAHVNLADVYARRGFLDQAIEALERALALDPFNETAIYNMAIVQAQLGEEAVAAAMLERLLEVNPRHEPARRALAHLTGHPAPTPPAAGGGSAPAHSR